MVTAMAATDSSATARADPLHSELETAITSHGELCKNGTCLNIAILQEGKPADDVVYRGSDDGDADIEPSSQEAASHDGTSLVPRGWYLFLKDRRDTPHCIEMGPMVKASNHLKGLQKEWAESGNEVDGAVSVACTARELREHRRDIKRRLRGDGEE